MRITIGEAGELIWTIRGISISLLEYDSQFFSTLIEIALSRLRSSCRQEFEIGSVAGRNLQYSKDHEGVPQHAQTLLITSLPNGKVIFELGSIFRKSCNYTPTAFHEDLAECIASSLAEFGGWDGFVGRWKGFLTPDLPDLIEAGNQLL